MTGDRKPPDPTRRSQRSRQAIPTATTDLVGEVGYTRLTVEAIAARAGVGKQTIYRWCRTRARCCWTPTSRWSAPTRT